MGRIFKPKRRTLLHHINIGNGALWADFYVDTNRPDGCYLHIYSDHHVFEHKVTGEPYLYLMESVRQDKVSEVEAYCAMIWRLSTEIYQDIDLCKDIIKAFTDRDERLLKKGAEKAAEVTDLREEADQAFMTDVAREADRHRPAQS